KTQVSLVVGGSLIAVGNATSPVVFTSSDNVSGHWSGIDFLAGATGTLTECVIRDGGSGGFQIRETNPGGVTLTSCVIAGHTNKGLVLSNASGSVTGCQFRDFGRYPA